MRRNFGIVLLLFLLGVLAQAQQTAALESKAKIVQAVRGGSASPIFLQTLTATELAVQDWFNEKQFIIQMNIASASDSLLFARLGANDPNFDLRRDAFNIHRKPAAKDHLFGSIISAHGKYDSVSEIASFPYAEKIVPTVLLDNGKYTIVSVSIAGAARWLSIIGNETNTSWQQHALDIGGQTYTWNDPLLIQKN